MAATTMNTEQARFNMIEQQIRPWGVMDAHLLDLLQRVKREDFCPPAYRNLAFADLQIPLPYGEMMLEPRVQARLVQDLQLKPTDKVLQIGTGTGYMTALLASRSQQVQAFEIHPELVKQTEPDFAVDGPIQFDAAMDPSVGKSKMPGSQVAGQATVFIFPDLNTGNNTYKAVQRTSGAIAVGPVLQGLNKPVNDLSRGALVADIVNTVAITAIQAQTGI